MTVTSFERLLKGSRLAMPAIGVDAFRGDHSLRVTRPDRETLEGKVQGHRPSAGTFAKVPKLSQKLDKRIPMKGRLEHGRAGSGVSTGSPGQFDIRQRAVIKVHYFNHAGGGGAALKSHVKYVARDAAVREDQGGADLAAKSSEARAYAKYIVRANRAGRSHFYDNQTEGVDGAQRAENWAKADRRHFRVILSAENGATLHDLPVYTREVMARAGATLDTKLSWIAVDHHDTDNPHTHIIIRGRRANGQDLVLPKDFVRHGFRNIARDVATDWLGRRSPADERLALDRDVIRHAFTRLDRMIDAQLPNDRSIRIANLEAPNGDLDTTRALKARARELERMGLAREVKRNVLTFEPNWRDRLQSMELHLDIRKMMMRQRMQDRAAERDRDDLSRTTKGRTELDR